MTVLEQTAKDRICEGIAEGKSLRAILRQHPDLPSSSMIFRALTSDAEFREQYARAREAQADTHFDEILEIADDLSEDANSRRVRVDARKWAASKLKPKVYGEKLDLNHSGAVKFEKIECVVVDPAAGNT